MNMDMGFFIFMMGVILSIIGWFVVRKINDLETADKEHVRKIEVQNTQIMILKEDKAELELRIAENYIKRSEIKDYMEKIDKHLEKIYERINAKADK